LPAEWLTFVFGSAWIDPYEKRTAGLCAREIGVLTVLAEIITVQILHVNENIDKRRMRMLRFYPAAPHPRSKN
jgi:hypothetical protein